jgi:PadR family transcriptional regulator, regulatory protein AphA
MKEFFEARATEHFDPALIFRDCIENGASSLLLDRPALPDEFFDLSTGLAGELLHRLSVYHMRMAAVIPDLTVHSVNFQTFASEANRGEQFRFFPTRREAIDWLESI